MKSSISRGMVVAGISMALVAFAGILGLAVKAQAQEMQQHLAELKQLLAFNKQAMANYTWLEQQIISVKGEQKKEEIYNVQLGPDGKPQKTPIDPGSVSDSERKRRGLRGRIVEKKTEEYEEYGNSIKTLIQQYLPPDKDMLQLSYQAGNVMIGPMGGQPNEYRVVVTNYLKQGDNLTIVMDKSTMALVSVSVATYLTDTSDAVNVNVQFAKMPNGGPFHVSTETINGVSKQLTIVIENSNYAQK